MEVVKQEVSKELDYKIDFKDGKAAITITYSGAGGGVSTTGYVNAEYFLDMIAKAIPGVVDDAIILALKAAL